MSKNKTSGIELPTVLAFERKLEVSDGLMYGGVWGDSDFPDPDQKWQKIAIKPRLNRSTISAFNTKDENKSKPNPVAAENDDANLPTGKDTLKVTFSLRVIGGLGRPFACNSSAFSNAIVSKVDGFIRSNGNGLGELAYRYAYNIANGRFLWRNRVCAEKIRIEVRSNVDSKSFTFNAHEFALNDFSVNSENIALKELAQIIKQGLGSIDDYVFLEVDAYVKLGDKQHVFPSQEMNMGEKKKVLFQLDNCAAIHNVKIGNALRTIDNWYVENAEFPIAAEPFGAVTQKGEAYRKNKNDLYSLMHKWVNSDNLEVDDENYVIANLVRGGVFGGKGE